jgi:hypothetical protein
LHFVALRQKNFGLAIKTPSVLMVENIAKALDVSIEELLK